LSIVSSYNYAIAQKITYNPTGIFAIQMERQKGYALNGS
jgi:hypothetical protein